MQRNYWLKLIIVFVIVVSALLTAPVPAYADGSFSNLYFPTASATDCGKGWKIEGAYGAATGQVFTYSLKDGRGSVVMSGSYTFRQQGTLTALEITTTAPFKPRKNPMHFVMKSNGQVVADLKANIPCLPPPPPPPAKFDPATIKVEVQPTDRLIVQCRRNQFIISGVNDKGRKYSLTTLSLDKVLAAGGGGLVKDLRREGKLTLISAGGGNFVLQWVGGRWNADGQVGSGFAKNFACPYKQ
jgi:hypothetical protein